MYYWIVLAFLFDLSSQQCMTVLTNGKIIKDGQLYNQDVRFGERIVNVGAILPDPSDTVRVLSHTFLTYR